MSDIEWNNFIIEGEELYAHMINNLESMFDGDKIKHFNIRDCIYGHIEDTDSVRNLYGEDIQKKIISWIKQELKEDRLFNKTLWKPFRDQNSLSDMYYGYRKLFQYEKYYFQLTIETSCSLYECEICDLTDDTFCLENSKHFEIALYGWKREDSLMLQPKNKIQLPSDNNMMPLKDWLCQ
jgi:hypothetical protein